MFLSCLFHCHALRKTSLQATVFFCFSICLHCEIYIWHPQRCHKSYAFLSTLFQVAKSYASTAWQPDSSNTMLLYFHFHATQLWIFNTCCCGVESQATVRGNRFLAKIEVGRKCNLCFTLRETFATLFSLLVYEMANRVFARIVNRCVFWFLRMAMWCICFLAYICLKFAAIFTIRCIGSPFFTPLPLCQYFKSTPTERKWNLT